AAAGRPRVGAAGGGAAARRARRVDRRGPRRRPGTDHRFVRRRDEERAAAAGHRRPAGVARRSPPLRSEGAGAQPRPAMSDSPGSPSLQQFVAMLREHTGNIVAADRYAFIEEIAERRARATGHGHVAGYVRALALGTLPGEWDTVVSLVTIKESYFFRAPQQFEALRQKVLPRLLRARAGSRRLRIWSAACARGEEPATLALVLAEERSLAGWDWSIVATDIDAEALAGAQRGLYGDRAIAQVPRHLLDRYFSRRGKLHELHPELLARIEYRRLNL